MIMLNSLRRAASMSLGAIVAVALLTSASQAQQAYPSPEDAAAALAAAVKTGDAEHHSEGPRQGCRGHHRVRR